ncbi:MAG: hypothetical protein QXP70_02630 [Methanomassiliicoccales archaeon]
MEKEGKGQGKGMINDNLVILLLIVFTLMIGAWMFVNMYMGRWI